MDSTPPQDAFASSRAILEALPAHIAVLDERGTILEVNEAWRRFGRDNGLDERLRGPGGNYFEACEGAVDRGVVSAEEVRKGIREVIAGRLEGFVHEYPCHGPQARRWFQMSVSPVRGGLAPGAVVMHIDITQRRLAELGLAEQAEALRAAQRLAGLGHWHLDCDTMRVALSDDAVGMLGLASGESPRSYESLLLRLHEDDRALVDARLRDLIARGGEEDLQHRVRRSDGEVRWFRVRVARVPRSEGTPPRLSATWIDITERRSAGEALRESEARYRRSAQELASIFDSSLDLICTLDSEQRFVRVSAACTRLLDFAPGELIGRPLRDFVVPDDQESLARLAAGIRAGTPVSGFESRLRRKDGSVAHFSWSARWSPADGILYCVGRDNSEALLIAAANRHLSERLRDSLERMTDGFITLDRELRLTYVNGATEAALRLSREQLLGKSIFDAFPGLHTERFATCYRAALAQGVAIEFEEYYPPLGVWVEVRVFPVPEGLAIYFRDVSERHEAQRALVESEARFKLVAEATTDATWDWDVRGGRSWWSDGWSRFFGATPGVAIERGVEYWLDCIHPEDRERVRKSIFDAVEGEAVLWCDHYRLRRSDGTYAHVSDRGYVMRDAWKRPVRMVGGVNDLTEQLEARDRLLEQAQLLDAARDAIQVRDLDHRILYWNHGAESLYGWSASEAVGRSAAELLHHDAAAFHDASERLLRDGAWSGELEKQTRDGRKLLVEGRWTLLRDADGRPGRILSIDTDVTERRQLERQLIRAQRMESIGTLAGGVAHDLNNVLTPILMSANLLRDAQMDAEQQVLLDAISTSAQRGADMISQLLSFARGAEGRHVPFDVASVVRDVRRIATETFPRDIEVSLEVEPGAWTAHGDPTQLHQVVLNLCVNARDAMPTGGMLGLVVRGSPGDGAAGDGSSGPQVLIEVGDTGTGMREDVLERIFDPFFTTKDPGKGTGLGLPTSLAIVKRHGGAMRVESEPGRGSRFTICLPASEEAVQPGAQGGEKRLRGDGQTVLLVDDEAPIREVGEQTLRAYGYVPVVAADGSEALSLYAKLRGNIDVVLVDMMMPVMDGSATIQALRRLNPSVRIVATSGIADDRHVTVAQDAGVAAFLPKPYTVDSLLAVLERALRAQPTT